MSRRVCSALLPLFLLGKIALGSTPEPSPNETHLLLHYLALYTRINDAEQAERKGHFDVALQDFKNIYDALAEIQQANPDWEPALIIHRMDDAGAKVLYLQSETGHDAVGIPFLIKPPEKKNSYPWKADILPSVFWIGENHSSAWNKNWALANNGADIPNQRNGFAPATHAASLGTFYVALPFNDIAYPDLARRWLPAGWTQTPRGVHPLSTCQDRWVEIKNGKGDVCYAQWEDVGPSSGDDAAYVFGTAPPRAHSGINVSPAVADYLNINEGTPVRWRFVDAQDVSPGAWLKYEEEALLFRALHLTEN